jgi:hypothetical protein
LIPSVVLLGSATIPNGLEAFCDCAAAKQSLSLPAASMYPSHGSKNPGGSGAAPPICIYATRTTHGGHQVVADIAIVRMQLYVRLHAHDRPEESSSGQINLLRIWKPFRRVDLIASSDDRGLAGTWPLGFTVTWPLPLTDGGGVGACGCGHPATGGSATGCGVDDLGGTVELTEGCCCLGTDFGTSSCLSFPAEADAILGDKLADCEGFEGFSCCGSEMRGFL